MIRAQMFPVLLALAVAGCVGDDDQATTRVPTTARPIPSTPLSPTPLRPSLRPTPRRGV
jgi:hypothetical protein